MPLKGFSVKEVYFDGTDRNFYNDLDFGLTEEQKKSEITSELLGRAFPDGDKIRLNRLQDRNRWGIRVMRYKNTSLAPTDRFIPADPAPDLEGRFLRYIYFEFKGRVENNAHEIAVRLRDTTGSWLHKNGTKEIASRQVRVSSKEWERFDGVIGPVRADRPCYVSLEILPGPAGDNQSLFLQDLQLMEVRKNNE